MLTCKMNDQMSVREYNSPKSLKLRSPADGEEQGNFRKAEVGNKKNKITMSSVQDNEEGMPPYCRWAKNLHNLLNDCDGVYLFKQYLKQECQDSYCLDFWFAAKGVQVKQDDDTKKMLMKIISNQYLHKLPDISPDTKSEIVDKIRNKDFDDTLFEKAQKEVETIMMRTTYPNFLKSDLYMQHIQQMQQNSNNNNNSELENSNVSCADSAEQSPRSCFKGSIESLDILQTVYEDSELQITNRDNKSVAIPGLRRPVEKDSKFARPKPEFLAGHYLKPNTPGYNTCYTKYSAYLPPSAQDSELQSLSSDAQTDDAMSIISSSTDRDTGYHHKNYQRPCYEKHHRSLKPSAPFNVDALPSNDFIPRTESLPAIIKQSPEEFAADLTDRLNKILQEQKVRERLNNRMQDVDNRNEVPVFPAVPSHGAPNLAFPKIPSAPDTAQSILDDHVSRVFFDSAHQTPSPSPGCLTPSANNATTQQEPLIKRRDAPAAYHNLPSCYMYAPPYTSRSRKDLDNTFDSGTEFSNDYDCLQSANVFNQQRLAHSHHTSSRSMDSVDHGYGRCKDSSRRSSNRKPSSVDCNSSCFDSGISGIDVASCSTNTHQKITTWLECSTSQSVSPILGQSSRKSGTCRSGQMDFAGSSQWQGSNLGNYASLMEAMHSRNVSGVQSALFVDHYQYPSISDPDTQMMLTKKGFDYVKQKLKPFSNSKDRTSDPSRSRSSEDNLLHKKSSRKSFPSAVAVPQPQMEMTPIAYCYGRGSVPFLCKLPGKFILLKQFKSLLCKKGNFKYFFRTANEEFGVVYEEISDDSDVLPIWEGKIFCVIQQME